MPADPLGAPRTTRCGYVTNGYRCTLVRAVSPGTAEPELRDGFLDRSPDTLEVRVSP